MQSTRKINLQCPVCGIAQFRFRFEKKGRDFWRCMSCAGELLYPLPTVGGRIEFPANASHIAIGPILLQLTAAGVALDAVV